jgi:hypothetical protein
MDTLSQSDFMTQFKECIMLCSEKKGHEYKYVYVINEWCNETFIKYVKSKHYANDPYHHILLDLNENDDKDTHFYLLNKCKHGDCTTIEELVEYLVNDMLNLEKNNNEQWVKC